MGHLSSISQEISAIRFVAFPTRSQKALKVVRVDTTILAHMGSSVVATNRVNAKFSYPSTSTLDNVVIGLHRLGLISKAAMAEHIEHCRKHDERQKKRYAAEDIKRAAATLGIKLTAAQLAKTLVIA